MAKKEFHAVLRAVWNNFSGHYRVWLQNIEASGQKSNPVSALQFHACGREFDNVVQQFAAAVRSKDENAIKSALELQKIRKTPDGEQLLTAMAEVLVNTPPDSDALAQGLLNGRFKIEESKSESAAVVCGNKMLEALQEAWKAYTQRVSENARDQSKTMIGTFAELNAGIEMRETARRFLAALGAQDVLALDAARRLQEARETNEGSAILAAISSSWDISLGKDVASSLIEITRGTFMFKETPESQ